MPRTASTTSSTARKSRAAAPPSPEPGSGISRVDQAATRTHGYVVRLGYKRTDGGWRPQHTSFFGDASHGGAAEALRAAERWARAARRKK